MIFILLEYILKKNNIEEIIEVYMGNLIGEKNYDRYGLTFPLLIKSLDCNDVLSVQVHPDDELAAERHNSYGKTESHCCFAFTVAGIKSYNAFIQKKTPPLQNFTS